MIEFILNNEKIQTDRPTGSLLLDLIRYDRCLTGTKIGCREGDCGACTVLVGEPVNGRMKYTSVTSCLTPIANVHGKHVVTIEGLNMDDLSPVQHYMIEEAGTQCGFCTVGFVVSLSGFCLSHSSPTYEEAIAAIDGNICRCTGYKSIERAARHVTDALAGKDTHDVIQWLVERKFIPSYFATITSRLQEIAPPAQAINGNGMSVGGGTDLYVQRPDDLVIQEISPVATDPALRFIKTADGSCLIGGATTVTDLQESEVFRELFPALAAHIKLVSSSPIRNMSTLAGNFVNASPIGDLTAFFLALHATITLTSGNESRTIYLKDFYKGYKKLDRKEGEMITAISFKLPASGHHFNFEKVSKRTHLDIASVNTAAQFIVSDQVITSAHVSAGGVAPVPTYLHETCAFLKDKELKNEHILAAAEIMQSEVSPISDVRGTADYKRLLLRQLFFAHFIRLFPDNRHEALITESHLV